MRQLPAEAALSRALNGGQPPWKRTEVLIADLWALWAKQDHPLRAAAADKARRDQKNARVIKLRTLYGQKKRRYGLR